MALMDSNYSSYLKQIVVCIGFYLNLKLNSPFSLAKNENVSMKSRLRYSLGYKKSCET